MLAAIASIPDDAWTPIHYPHAVFDEQLQQWISDAELAEIPFTAFRSRAKAAQIPARLIVRRVRDANPDHVHLNAQGELFRVWRHHAIFTDSPLPTLEAEADHRKHAIIEQVIADLKNGPLAHLPSGSFAANSAWLVLATIAFNLTRAIGALASQDHAKATTATIRTQLINIATRVVHSARRNRLRLPAAWPWASAWQRLFTDLTPPTATRPTGEPSGNAEQIGGPPTPVHQQAINKINYGCPPCSTVDPGLVLGVWPRRSAS